MSVFAVVKRLAPIIKSQVNLVIDCKQVAASLSKELNKIQMVLQDAEMKGVTDISVKCWLKELEDVTYEIDDVLDECESGKLRIQVEDMSWDKVHSLLVYVFSCLCIKQLWLSRKITIHMKGLTEKIDKISKDKDKYAFASRVNYHAQEFKQEVVTSVDKKGKKYYGLDKNKDSLVKKLVSEGGDTQIISIVGLGGVGKSTLARVAFKDPQVNGHFYLKGWVSVSQNLESLDIAKAILESFTDKSVMASTLEMVVQRIKRVVFRKRFLLVLDNMWEGDCRKWEEIKSCLYGRKGCKIVVTTRSSNVATKLGGQLLHLGVLTEEDCGKILNEVALAGKTKEDPEMLSAIGMKVAKKCNGLPLVAISLGGMLAMRSSGQEWRDVLESPLWGDVLESPLWMDKGEQSEVYRNLNLSYMDLHPVVKRCLLSSVIFPKGSWFSFNEISRVWMAYGYLNSNGSVDKVQSEGLRYLEELTARSFFKKLAGEDNPDNDRKLYNMHDIIHEFASHVSKSDGYSFIGDRDGGLKELPLNSLGRFRTCCVSGEELCPDRVNHLTRVRVLSVRDTNLQEIPIEVGKLVHLRYLNVSGNPITKLPEAIIDLCNLQTLDIERCKELSGLPQGIGKLIKLKHLVNSNTSKLVEFPQELEKQSGLQTLKKFRGRNLECLGDMNQLQGSLNLILHGLGEGEVGDPKLGEKKHLKELRLEFGEEKERDEVAEVLKLPPNLVTLEVRGGSGKWLSHCISTSFLNLKVISFVDIRQGRDVPPFYKLPALEDLKIDGCVFERLGSGFLGLDDANSSISTQVAGGFPRLKKLRIYWCDKWVEWEDIKEEDSVPILPLLKELKIQHCHAIKELPHRLLSKATSLRHINLFRSRHLYYSYNERFGPHRDKISKQGRTISVVLETRSDE